jgi:predicted HTH domain antitoxin
LNHRGENWLMTTITITLPDDLLTQLEPSQDNLYNLLRIGLREVRKEQIITLFKKRVVSLWNTARLAGLSLGTMTDCAVAQGLRAEVNEETSREELS